MAGMYERLIRSRQKKYVEQNKYKLPLKDPVGEVQPIKVVLKGLPEEDTDEGILALISKQEDHIKNLAGSIQSKQSVMIEESDVNPTKQRVFHKEELAQFYKDRKEMVKAVRAGNPNQFLDEHEAKCALEVKKELILARTEQFGKLLELAGKVKGKDLEEVKRVFTKLQAEVKSEDLGVIQPQVELEKLFTPVKEEVKEPVKEEQKPIPRQEVKKAMAGNGQK